jgi:2-dehydropantoate 2-reductase
VSTERDADEPGGRRPAAPPTPRTLVVGAGAVGGVFGGLLARAGCDVSFVARGAHAAAMRERGLRVVEDVKGEWTVPCPRVVEDPRPLGAMDLVLVCVKSYGTVQAARLLAPCATPRTIVLSLQNGVENEEIIAREAGLAPLLLAVTYVSSELAAPGLIRLSGDAQIVFGEPALPSSPRTDRLTSWLAAAGVAHRVSRRMPSVVWDKLAWNAAFNAVGALTGRTAGGVLDGPGEALVRAAMREALDVARGLGVEVRTRIDDVIAHARERIPDTRTSMLQDRERGGRLEHDALNGAVVRAGRRAGVATPIHETLDALLTLVDARR